MALPLFNQEIISQLRKAALEQEKTATISAATLEFIYQHKLFKLFVPEAFGGRMAGLPEAVRIFEQASFIDGSLGWAVTIGAGGGFFSAYLPPEAAAKLFTPENAVVAGSGHPTGSAIKTEG